MNKILAFLISLSFLSLNTFAEDNPSNLISEYQKRYPLTDVYMKLIDNYGNGYDLLYGTRNVRTVLNGVLYRGGANNYFHKTNPRENMNPLPEDGLNHLCEEGFSTAVYLYTTNFDTASPKKNCKTFRGANHELIYLQESPFSQSSIKKMFTLIHQTIFNSAHGPVYTHCWNGWHASGLISALSLRQFCGLTGEAAVTYWDANTDGNNKEEAYEKIRQQILDFVPYQEFNISAAAQKLICPAK